jgi:hypothetical protein
MSLRPKAKTSSIIQFSVPDHLRESNPLFVQFVKYYYEFLEGEGNAGEFLQELLHKKDIDDTDDKFVDLIWGFYSNLFPDFALVDKRILVKNVKSFFKSKGTFPSYQFIINAIYGDEVELRYNNEKVFRASANSYDKKSFISIKPDLLPNCTDRKDLASIYDFSDAVGAQLYQEETSSRGFIEAVAQREDLDGHIVFVLEINSKEVKPNFIKSKPVQARHRALNTPILGIVSPSIVNIKIPAGSSGAYYKPNDLISFNSGSGEGAVARVDSVSSGSIDGIIINKKGKGYAVGDLITCNDLSAGGSEFLARVESVDGIGAKFRPVMEIDNISISNAGLNFVLNDEVILSDIFTQEIQPIQFRATVNSIASNTEISKFNIRSFGEDYVYAKAVLVDNTTGNILDKTGSYSIDPKINTTDRQLPTVSARTEQNITQKNGSIYDLVFTDLNVGADIGTNKNLSVLVNGFGCRASAVVSSGSITGVNLVNSEGGYNYVDPIVFIEDASGTGANVTATVNSFGSINATTIVSGGTNYVTPMAEITDLRGSGAEILQSSVISRQSGIRRFGGARLISGVLNSVNITKSGSNYVNPYAIIYDAAGVGAEISLTNSSGSIVGASVTVGGQAYVNPIIKIIDAKYNGAKAYANVNSGAISSISVTQTGTAYSDPICIISDVSGVGATANVTVDNDGIISSVNMTSNGVGYINPQITIVEASGKNAAITLITSAGVITGRTIVNAGVNYGNPQIRIYDAKSLTGNGAFVKANKNANGSITSFTVVSGGSRYANPIIRVLESKGPTSSGGAVIRFTTNGSGVITGATIVKAGVGYKNPEIVFNSYNCVYPTLNISKTTLGEISGITIVYGGSGFPSSSSTIYCVVREKNNSNNSELLADIIYPTKVTGQVGQVGSLNITNRGEFYDIPNSYDVPLIKNPNQYRSGGSSESKNTPIGIGLLANITFRIKRVDTLSGGRYYHFGGGLPVANTQLVDSGDGIGNGLKLALRFDSGSLVDAKVINAGRNYLYVDELRLISGFIDMPTNLSRVAIVGEKWIYNGIRYVVVVGGTYVAGTGVGSTIYSMVNTLNSDNETAECPTNGPTIIRLGYDVILSTQFSSGELVGLGISNAGSNYRDSDNVLLSGWYDDMEIRNKLQESSVITCNGISTGAIITAKLEHGGSGYFSADEIVPLKIEITSSGVTPVSTPKIIPVLSGDTGSIDSVIILDGGNGFDQNTTTLTLTGGRHASSPIILSEYDMRPVVYNGRIVAVDIKKSPTGLKYGTSVEILGDGTDADISLTIESGITGFTIIDRGDPSEFLNFYVNYDGIMPLIIENDSGSPPPTTYAKVDAIINSNGIISDIIIRDPGVGYIDPVYRFINSYAELEFFADHRIKSVNINNGGTNYDNAEVFILSDGSGANIKLELEKQGGITSTNIISSGIGYTRIPTLFASDLSGYGAISSVKLLNRGRGFSVVPTLNLPLPDFDNTRESAKLIGVSNSIGGISGVSFESFGYGYDEIPTIAFPLTATMQNTRGYKLAERVHVAGYPYKYQELPSGSNLNLETGDSIKLESKLHEWLLLEDAGVDIETGQLVLLENGNTIKLEQSFVGDLSSDSWLLAETIYAIGSYALRSYTNSKFLTLSMSDRPEKYGIKIGDSILFENVFKYQEPNDVEFSQLNRYFLVDGIVGYTITLLYGDYANLGDEKYTASSVKVFDFSSGPHGTISDINSGNNQVTLINATDSYKFVAENKVGSDSIAIVSESGGFTIAAEYSYPILSGDTLVGNSSGFASNFISTSSKLHSFSRASGIAVNGALGLTKGKYKTFAGLLNNRKSLLTDSEKIQDFSYVVRTGLSLPTYQKVLYDTVHPAGYKMLGEILVDTNVDFPNINMFGSDIWGNVIPPITLILSGEVFDRDIWNDSTQKTLFIRRFNQVATMSDVDKYSNLFDNKISEFDYSIYPMGDIKYEYVDDSDIITEHNYSKYLSGPYTGMVSIQNNRKRNLFAGEFINLSFNSVLDSGRNYSYNTLYSTSVTNCTIEIYTNVVSRTGGFDSSGIVIGDAILNPNIGILDDSGSYYTNYEELGPIFVMDIDTSVPSNHRLILSNMITQSITNQTLYFSKTEVKSHTKKAYLLGDAALDLSNASEYNITESKTTTAYNSTPARLVWNKYKITKITESEIIVYDSFGLASNSGTCRLDENTWDGYSNSDNSVVNLVSGGVNPSGVADYDYPISYVATAGNVLVTCKNHNVVVGGLVHLSYAQVASAPIPTTYNVTQVNSVDSFTVFHSGLNFTGKLNYLMINFGVEANISANTTNSEYSYYDNAVNGPGSNKFAYSTSAGNTTVTCVGHLLKLNQKILLNIKTDSDDSKSRKYNVLVTITAVTPTSFTFLASAAGNINSGYLTYTIV